MAMNRRRVLTLIGAGGASVAGGIAAFKPALVIGSPRGKGEPVSIERTITDESLEYRPSTDEVRYPTLMNSNGPVAYETVPFGRWARRRCASVGSDAVLPAIQDRFQKRVEGISKAASSEYIGLVITVTAMTTKNRDGEVVAEPNISYESLVDAAPRTVHTTVRLEGREHTRAVPVFVEEGELAYL